MSDALLSAILSDTYTRSALLRRVGLLQEFAEFVFFTKQAPAFRDALIDEFSRKQNIADRDQAFLKRVTKDSNASLTPETLYHRFQEFERELETLPELLLVVSVVFEEEQLDYIGGWIREHIGKEILLNIETKPELAVGCQFVWNGALHDFSLARYFKEHREDVHQALASLGDGQGGPARR
jgi:F0F1-type ATP synthase delta subunit